MLRFIFLTTFGLLNIIVGGPRVKEKELKESIQFARMPLVPCVFRAHSIHLGVVGCLRNLCENSCPIEIGLEFGSAPGVIVENTLNIAQSDQVSPLSQKVRLIKQLCRDSILSSIPGCVGHPP